MESYDDLKRAIATHVLRHEEDGVTIIASENTGEHASWLFDFRALMLQPYWLNRYAEIFWQRFAALYPFQVGGVETAGLPLVAAIIMKGVERGTPVNGFYMRKSRKRRGLMSSIEGTLDTTPIIFVDDLINTGQSINKQLEILTHAGHEVADVFVLLAFRAADAYAFFSQKKITFSYLFTIEDFGIPLLRSKESTIPRDSFEVVWRFRAPHPSFHIVVPKSTPVVNESLVFFGCDDGNMRGINRMTGDVVWNFLIGRHPRGKGILSTPLIHKNLVYFGAYDGVVYALDAATGKKRWSYEDADWIGSSPDISTSLGLLYIGLEFGLWRKQGGIVALTLDTGTVAWSATHSGLTHGSPLYIHEESLVVCGSNDGILYAYNAKNGSARWRFATRGEIKAKAAYDPKRRAVLFGSMDGTLYAVSAIDGSPLFARETGAGIYSTPLVTEDTVYCASLDKCLYAIDCSTGQDRWVFETRGRIFSSPIFHDDSVWIGSNDGRLYEISAKSGKLLNFYQASERIVNSAVWKDNSLFVSTVANEVYCLKRKAG